jgi:hypothetical protein
MLTTKRPWWDKIVFVVVPYVGAQGTYWYFTQHCSLGLTSRYRAGCRWSALGGVLTDIGQTPPMVESMSEIA